MRRPIVLLSPLALIWGSSFMFIKVADRTFTPASLVTGRLGLAALSLLLIVPALVGRQETLAALRAAWRPLIAVGLVNTALPFWLLSWGETRIDSGLASIIQASVPIFNALIAFGFFHDQRVGGRKLLGVAIGFVGVALLVGAQPHAKVLGAVAVVGMALCYGTGGLMVRRFLTGTSPYVVALGSTGAAAIAILPAGILDAPDRVPSGASIASVCVLGVVCTAVAYLLNYTLIAEAGAAYSALVTYLIPPIALFYGAVFLGEGVGASALAGLVLILGGVALGTGAAVRRISFRGARSRIDARRGLARGCEADPRLGD
jgi:drug/metabolite transporter (DMT)-like permease